MADFAVVRWQGAKNLPDYLRPQEAHQIIEAATGPAASRDKVFLELILQTGLRISEALKITPADLAWLDGQPVLKVRQGKGKKDRRVAMPYGLAAHLAYYAGDRRVERGDRIFPFTRQRAWQIIKRAAAAAGVDKNVYPHLFRHSYSIEFLRQTGHPQALMTLLGHSSSAMTMRYLRLLQEEDALKIAQEVEV